jgi:hypothetical protein
LREAREAIQSWSVQSNSSVHTREAVSGGTSAYTPNGSALSIEKLPSGPTMRYL